MDRLIAVQNNNENRSSNRDKDKRNEQMSKYGDYATLTRLQIDKKKPERFTFGEKFYVNEIKQILNPKDELMIKINDENAQLTKRDWN